MAEKPDSGEGWWGSWIQAAKEKSNDALEFVRRDLAEFGLTVQNDTTRAVSKTSSTLKETLKAENTATATTKLKDGLSNFLGGITNALTIQPEDKDDVRITTSQTANLFDRSKARLHAIQVDPGTYCNSPSGPQERYQEWLETFDLENRKGNISELLVSKVEVRSLYTRLVPSEISHGEFWQHYFYKVHQLQLDEARKLAMMKRAEKVGTKEDSMSWDDDWSDEEGKGPAEERLKLPAEDKNEKKQSALDSEESSEPNGCEVYSDKDSDVGDSVSDGRENDDRASPGGLKTDIATTSNKPEEKSDGENNSECDKVGTSLRIAESRVDEPVLCIVGDSAKAESADTGDSAKSESADTDLSKEHVKTDTELCTKVKGDMVVVSPDRESPSSESSGAKDVSSVSEDWEQDFDVELTEEDLKAAEELAKNLNLTDKDYNTITGDLGEDWENWE